MIRLKTEEGTIAVDNAVYTNIAGYAATNCFGVKGMAVRSMTDGLVHLLRITVNTCVIAEVCKFKECIFARQLRRELLYLIV